MSGFSERVLCTIAVTLLYGEYSTLDVFLPNGVFLPYGHGLDFDISFLCENSINQSINQSLSLRQRRERRTPEGRWTRPRTMGPVVPHSAQRQVTEAWPEHRRRPWPVAWEHATRSSAYDAGADRRHPLLGERKGCRTGRSLRWAVQDHPQRWSRAAPETARHRRPYLEGGRGAAAAVERCHHHGTP